MSATRCSSLAALSGTRVPKLWNPPAQRSTFGDVVLVAFLLAQCFDGVFTYVGVVSFGLAIEGNPIVAALMTAVGEGAGLFSAKVVAMVLGIGLHLRQVHGAVALLTALYVVVAVLPWMAILFQ